MSVTTNAQLNPDQLLAALPTGAGFSCVGDLTTATPKTVTFVGTDDAAGQAAIATASAAFVDRAANAATLRSRAQAYTTAAQTYQGLATPTAAQTAAMEKATTKAVTALIRIALGQLDDMSGT